MSASYVDNEMITAQPIQILDSAEKRYHIIKRDVDSMLEEVAYLYPETPGFELQSIPDVATFRIQQQQIPPQPSASQGYPKAQSTDAKKVDMDAQNDKIVAGAEEIRQKITYIEELQKLLAVPGTEEPMKLYCIDSSKGHFRCGLCLRLWIGPFLMVFFDFK